MGCCQAAKIDEARNKMIPKFVDKLHSHKLDQKKVELKPGKLGLDYDKETGVVNKVDALGDCSNLGILPGWKFHKIKGKPYDAGLLDECINSAHPYNVIFVTTDANPAGEVHHQATPVEGGTNANDLKCLAIGEEEGVHALIDAAIKVLELAKANKEQFEFFGRWVGKVFKVALPNAKHHVLLVSTDFTHLEVRIEADIEVMQKLVAEFASSINHTVEQDKEARRILDLREMCQAVNALTIWCKIKRMGSPNPGVDAGFVFVDRIDWSMADLLMPPAVDQDSLREFCIKNKHYPSEYSSSAFPKEPERGLGFLLENDAPNQLLTEAILFFHPFSLKPEEQVLRIMERSSPESCNVHVAMGRKGLTRVALRMTNPKDPAEIAKHLAGCLNFNFKETELDQVRSVLSGELATSIEYAAEARGYAVLVGFTGRGPRDENFTPPMGPPTHTDPTKASPNPPVPSYNHMGPTPPTGSPIANSANSGTSV